MSPSDLFRLAVAVDGRLEDPISGALNEAADGGGVEILDQRAAQLVPELAALAPGYILIRAYLTERQVEAARAALRRWPEAEVYPVEPVDTGWTERWKAFFRPTPVGERLLVRPPWEPLAGHSGRLDIIIEPGMAFGTGTHETTQLCLAALEQVLTPAVAMLDLVMLDVGCGSGVLSIAAVKLGVASVVAIDIDIESERATRENAHVNGVGAHVEASTTPLAQVPGRYALVVANILSSILLTLAESLWAHVAPGGTLLLSGILLQEGDAVSQVFSALGAREQERFSQAEWVAIRFSRP